MIELEKKLLGILMYDSDQYFANHDKLHIDLFTNLIYKKIFSSIAEVCTDYGVLDIISVSSKIKNENNIIVELQAIEDQDVYSININNVIDELTEKYKRRKLKALGSILSSSESMESDKTIQVVHESLSKLLNSQSKVIEFDEVISALISHINDKKDGMTGLPTGFIEYDRHTKGLQEEDLIIVAAETSQGKTSFAISMINNVLKYNSSCLFISLEMSRNQLTARLLSNNINVSSKDVLFDSMNDIKKQVVEDGLNAISHYPLYIDDSGSSNFNSIVNTIKKYKLQKDIKVVAVDYIQLMNNRTTGGNKEQEIGDIARGLKNLAKELKITIIALSQLSRDKQNPTPSMNRLRQSGQIEEAADQVILLFRPEFYDIQMIELDCTTYETKGLGIVYLAKGRNVGTTKFLMNFTPERTMWHDQAPQFETNLNPF